MIKIPFSSYDPEDARSYLLAVAQLRSNLRNEKGELEKKLNDFGEKLDDERLKIEEIYNDEKLQTGSTTIDSTYSADDDGDTYELEQSLEICRNLQYAWSYLLLLKNVEKLNDELEENVKSFNYSSTSVIYDELKSIDRSLKTSECSSLKKFVKSCRSAWKRFLIGRMRENVAKILDDHDLPKNLDSLQNVAALKTSLLEMAKFAYSLKSNFDEFTDAVLAPFRLRFVFHFTDPLSKICDSSKNLKPEWYLSLILKWQRKFAQILTNFGDDDSGRQISVDFARGLVCLARDRLKLDLNFVAEDDKILPHLIDEAIAFDLELRSSGYPESDVGCIELLTEPCIFEAWLDLEHQQCTKCVENLLTDPSAWRLRYTEASDLDHFKVPRCADSFLSLLTAMTHRYRLLRSRGHRLRFVHLQRALLDDFRMHLFQLTRSSPTPWTEPFPQIVNATAYVKLVLSRWQETPLYVDAEPGVFDELIDLFEHFRRQMLSDAREAAAEELKPCLMRYRHEFSGRNSLPDNALAHVSVPLQSRLSEAGDLLSETNFRDFLRLFADSLEKQTLDHVVFEIRADAKSGERLKEQLAVRVPQMFRAFGLPTDAGGYFQKLSQCLSVFELNSAGCLLLRETLKNAELADNVIAEMGLTSLTLAEIEALLQRRSDLVAL